MRPERIQLFPPEQTANRLNGTVEALAYHGLDLQLHIRTPLSAKPFLVRVTADAADRRPVSVGRRAVADSAGTPPTAQNFRRLIFLEERPMAQARRSPFSRKRPLARRSIPSASRRPSRRAATRRCSSPTPASSTSIKGYGFEAHPVNLSAPMPPEQMAQVLGGFHQRPHPELPQVALRPDRQLCEGLLDGDRRQRQMGAEGPARRARPRSSPTSICVDNVILFPADQAVRQAVGAHHLLLGERDRGPGHPAASVGLRARTTMPATSATATISTR